MPELPEVETVRRGLLPVLQGVRIDTVEARRGDLRKPFPPNFAKRLKGRTIVKLGRRAKFLVGELDDGNALIVHLGMSGSFRMLDEDEPVAAASHHHPRSRLTAHDHVVFHLSTGKTLVFNDPRRFGLMDLVKLAEIDEAPPFKRLGVEPATGQIDGAFLAERFRGRIVSLKAALIDQHLIAGLGNIYVSEALWRAKLSPERLAGTIALPRNRARAAALAEAIEAVIIDAIKAGGSSLRDHARVDGTLGEFQHHFMVYEREGEPCLRKPPCRGIIRRITQSGRSTYFCPVCQK